jgi:hypothetical protein
MPEGGRGFGPRVVIALLILALVGVAVLVTVGSRPEDHEAAPPSPSPTPSPAPSSPVPVHLVVKVRRVERIGVSGKVRRGEVRAAVRGVRDTVGALYRTSFVDPWLWSAGTFPGLVDSFAPRARAGARRDLGDLTLGNTARRLDGVDPRRARLDVGVLLGDRGRPISATAAMDFRAVGTGPAVGLVPIRHEGRYVLRPSGERWLIVAYDVRGRVGRGR